MSTIITNEAGVDDHEREQIARANASGHAPVVFVHGLWLLPSSWDRWATLFEEAGYAALTPNWPDDPATVAEANADPGVFAGKTIGQVADHVADVIGQLEMKPAVIGHSFGGLLAQIIAGRGLSTATVAIDPAPFRGVLPLPISSLRSARPVLGNPANRNRAVPLTYEQFRYGFANAVSEDEAKQLYDEFAVPAPGAPLFQAAIANLNPWTEAKVDTKNPDRGPLLLISGEKDHTVPWAITNASYKRQKHNQGVTEVVEIEGPRTRAHGRQRLARSRGYCAGVHQAVRLTARVPTYWTDDDLDHSLFPPSGACRATPARGGRPAAASRPWSSSWISPCSASSCTGPWSDRCFVRYTSSSTNSSTPGASLADSVAERAVAIGFYPDGQSCHRRGRHATTRRGARRARGPRRRPRAARALG